MTKLKLLKKDILVSPKNTNEVEKSIIHVQSEDEGKRKMNYFEVLDVSSEVTLVKPGDVILLEYMKHTPPMEWNGKMCAITSEDVVEAVLGE